MKISALLLGAVAAAAVVTASASEARADEALHEGFELGLRAGYGIAMGDAVKDGKLSDSVKGKIPIQLDVGYRVLPQLYVGAYFEYGIGLLASDVKDKCDDCSASNIRFGANAQYHFLPEGSILPWAGAGIGYEILSLGNDDTSSGLRGLEFVNVQLGADFVAAPNFRVGPFVQFSIGQYSTQSVKVEAADIDESDSIDDKGIHQWLTFGIRGAYNL